MGPSQKEFCVGWNKSIKYLAQCVRAQEGVVETEWDSKRTRKLGKQGQFYCDHFNT